MNILRSGGGMSRVNSIDLGTQDTTAKKPGALGFVFLAVVGLALIGFGLYRGNAPFFDTHIEDWINQARIEPSWTGVCVVGLVVMAIGVIGALARAFVRLEKPAAKRYAEPVRPAAIDALDAVPASDVSYATPSAEIIHVNPDMRRPSLKFDAQSLQHTQALSVSDAAEGSLHAEPPSMEVSSLEPAIFSDPAAFSDNASDSFMSREPEAVEAVPAFDPAAALSDTHGLHISAPADNVVPIRPDVAPNAGMPANIVITDHAPASILAADPVEAALLAPAPDVVTEAPQGDINAVINSVKRFAPEAPATAPLASSDPRTDVEQAVQTALSVWPEATRAIAADELRARLTKLHDDPAPESARAFRMIAAGDLSGGAASLTEHADTIAANGRNAEAAELWRISGALHMGRDDGRAMTAYEHVSELDPSDANIHLYLARRYQMAGDTSKQPTVIARALGVISDPATRAELLAPYADLKLKAGDARSAGDALDELSRLHEATLNARPDDLGARSTHALTVARLAQAREMQGAFDQAGPLYQKAHKAFAELSAMKPDHPGLRAMADNAFKDAARFNMA